MALSGDQLADIQGDLGISDDEAVFTDVELNRLFDRASSDYTTAVYYAWRQLLASAAKLVDWTAANTSVKASQVHAHIKGMVDFWEEKAKQGGGQVRIVGGLKIPTRHPDMPYDMQRRRSRYEINHGTFRR